MSSGSTGIVALVKIKKHNLSGKGYAIAGIIIGLLPGIIGLIMTITNLFIS
jgi:hypothetical protein